MRNFRKKDIVQVVMANTYHFDFQCGTTFIARIEHVPQGPGDPWEFVRHGVSDHDANTTVMKYIAINPSAADFIGLVRTEDIDFESD